jgi:hypothetical protein
MRPSIRYGYAWSGTFAWEDKFKRLLLRFEFKQQRHYGMKLIAYTLINLRHFVVPETRNQLMASSDETII